MKPLFILMTIVLGIVLPYGHAYTFLVRYLVMAMLFFALLDLEVNRRSLQAVHGKVLAWNLFLPILYFLCIWPFNATLALVAFVVAIAPTAAGGPIFADLLKTDVTLVTVSVLVTSVGVALWVPFLLPQVVEIGPSINIGAVLFPVFVVIFLPLFLAQGIRRFFTPWHRWLLQWKGISFILFLINVYIASSKASHFVQMDDQTDTAMILAIAATSAGCCLINFSIGIYLGRVREPIATGLALGRKNNMFA
ncbi:MAG: hypothetical protein AAGD05_15060, partial [Bacteroidota bacterium]